MAAMNPSLFLVVRLWLVVFLVTLGTKPVWSAEPRVQILSPKNGDRLTQDQSAILVSGKVASQTARSSNVDIMLVIDISGSTSNYAGADFAELADLPPNYLYPPGPPPGPQFGISIGRRGVVGQPRYEPPPPPINLRNSILAAEVVAARRLLSQLNPKTTRVGIITFSKEALLQQPLTDDFNRVRRILVDIYKAGPNGGTNMVDGIRVGIKELSGVGTSEKREDTIRVQLLLTDGLPSLPIGGGTRVTPEDINLTINAARLAGKYGIKVHVFALGEEALSYPAAAVGIAK
ncbi:MAG: VWA domain-containing protein, partial [Deltaproteobacteria bacterium]|nr:VWA domain-containing protein [Deltaproteobacteria bacterium]